MFFNARSVSLQLVSAVRYPVWDMAETPFQQSDWDARFVTLAVKGDTVRIGKSWWQTSSGTKFDASNVDELMESVAKWLAGRPETVGIGAAVLVPIPNSGSVPGIDAYRTKSIAQAMQSVDPKRLHVYDGLRFSTPQQSARSGGPRKKEDVLPHLVLTHRPAAGLPHILIDDVCTSGGHLFAAQELLRKNGVATSLALVGGRTVHQHEEPMFRPDTEELTTLWT